MEVRKYFYKISGQKPFLFRVFHFLDISDRFSETSERGRVRTKLVISISCTMAWLVARLDSGIFSVGLSDCLTIVYIVCDSFWTSRFTEALDRWGAHGGNGNDKNCSFVKTRFDVFIILKWVLKVRNEQKALTKGTFYEQMTVFRRKKFFKKLQNNGKTRA